MRVSGKHNDLDNVGPSLRHHTFFEMLGNFSFGDYFKKDAIAVRLDAADRRLEDAGGPAGGVDLQGRSTAFRATTRRTRSGERSACRRIASSSSAPTTTSGRWATPGRAAAARRSTTSAARGTDPEIEIWNNVFMEFERSADGTLTPLPAPSIDTGMGLERITAVLQSKESNYDTDVFMPLLARDRRAGRRPLRGHDERSRTSRCASSPTTSARRRS